MRLFALAKVRRRYSESDEHVDLDWFFSAGLLRSLVSKCQINPRREDGVHCLGGRRRTGTQPYPRAGQGWLAECSRQAQDARTPPQGLGRVTDCPSARTGVFLASRCRRDRGRACDIASCGWKAFRISAKGFRNEGRKRLRWSGRITALFVALTKLKLILLVSFVVDSGH
jgi:hypothetical protein